MPQARTAWTRLQAGGRLPCPPWPLWPALGSPARAPPESRGRRRRWRGGGTSAAAAAWPSRGRMTTLAREPGLPQSEASRRASTARSSSPHLASPRAPRAPRAPARRPAKAPRVETGPARRRRRTAGLRQVVPHRNRHPWRVPGRPYPARRFASPQTPLPGTHRPPKLISSQTHAQVHNCCRLRRSPPLPREPPPRRRRRRRRRRLPLAAAAGGRTAPHRPSAPRPKPCALPARSGDPGRGAAESVPASETT